MGVWYCTREDIESALDVIATSRSHTRIDRIIESESRNVEGLLHRRFYPERATRYFDWPNYQRTVPWRLWLDSNELISIYAFTSGSTSFVQDTDYFLRRMDDLSEPPYEYVELNLAASTGWNVGSTHQRNMAIDALYGHSANEDSAGTLAANVTSSSVTTIDVSDSAAIGIGDLVHVDSERMIVSEKSMITTGQTLQTPVGANNSEVTIAVSSGAAFAKFETIMLDAERMLIVEITGNNLIVIRGWRGSTLAAHTGSTIYAGRRLTVRRGVLGTTAATHTLGTAIARHQVPGPVRTLTIAQVLNTLLQESAGYARTAGSGDNVREVLGVGLDDARRAAVTTLGRQLRIGAV